MEVVVSKSDSFWLGKRVLVTGHTGFKGSWLSLCLAQQGAEVYGFAQSPPTTPNLYELAMVEEHLVTSTLGDVRDFGQLCGCVAQCKPQIIFHLAAQSLVRQSYEDPVETYATNVLGTVHLLEAVRRACAPCTVVNVTSDKCYENVATPRSFRESDALGGHDPYSNSKACAELVSQAYRASYFGPEHDPRVGLASVRAGNVIGGGDWSTDRLVPDCVRAITAGNSVALRNPAAVRPWQHVLEPLRGYMLLAEQLHTDSARYARAWNFGPDNADAWPVQRVVERLITLWDSNVGVDLMPGPQPHEAPHLALNCSMAHEMLDWRPRTDLDKGLALTVEWYRRVFDGDDAARITREQIEDFFSAEELSH